MTLSAAIAAMSDLRALTSADISTLSRRAARLLQMAERVDAALLGCELVMMEPRK